MQEKFTFFWNGEFSQWYPCKILVDGLEYNCAEQYMMAQKANLFRDQESHEKIMQATHPREQKSLGRQVKNFNLDKWNDFAPFVVWKGSWAKYTQHPTLRKKLLDTIGTTLVEASPYDKIWGIGLIADDDRAKHRSTWLGTNWLGEILTKVRNSLYESNYV